MLKIKKLYVYKAHIYMYYITVTMKEHRKNEGAQNKTPQIASIFAHLTENIGDRYRIGNLAQ